MRRRPRFLLSARHGERSGRRADRFLPHDQVKALKDSGLLAFVSACRVRRCRRAGRGGRRGVPVAGPRRRVAFPDSTLALHIPGGATTSGGTRSEGVLLRPCPQRGVIRQCAVRARTASDRRGHHHPDRAHLGRLPALGAQVLLHRCTFRRLGDRARVTGRRPRRGTDVVHAQGAGVHSSRRAGIADRRRLGRNGSAHHRVRDCHPRRCAQFRPTTSYRSPPSSPSPRSTAPTPNYCMQQSMSVSPPAHWLKAFVRPPRPGRISSAGSLLPQTIPRSCMQPAN